MTELRQALAEIRAISTQVARGTQFRGYGPKSIEASALLALAVAAFQSSGTANPGHEAAGFLTCWITVAALSVLLSAWETVTRARRVHDGFAKEMTHAAVEQFLPAIVAGVLLTALLVKVAPESAWMLPGLWELIFSLGIFASCRFLPRPMFAVGLWYLAAGLAWSISNGSLDIRCFFLGCVVIAGLYGAATASRAILFAQAIPGAIALAVTIAARS